MTDLNECIAYERISDGKIFLTRKIMKCVYVIYDPETSEKKEVSEYWLRKNLRIKKESYKNVKKRIAKKFLKLSSQRQKLYWALKKAKQ